MPSVMNTGLFCRGRGRKSEKISGSKKKVISENTMGTICALMVCRQLRVFCCMCVLLCFVLFCSVLLSFLKEF